MGISLYLSILPQELDPGAWEAAWDESLTLLERFPLGLLANALEWVGETPRIVHTRRLEQEAQDPTERHWHVVGDATTLRLGESFLVYRDPARYGIRGGEAKLGRTGGPPATAAGSDIVIEIGRERLEWEQSTTGAAPRLAHATVFEEKTQGEPYHEAILAVGMLFEARFPGAAAVYGDFIRADCDGARRLARESLGWDVGLPVVTRPRALAERLARYFQGERLVQAVISLSCSGTLGPTENAAPLVALLGAGREQEARRWLLSRLRAWGEDLSVEVAMDIVAWLNLTGDVATLCELTCLDPGGPRKSVLELTDFLVASGAVSPAGMAPPRGFAAMSPLPPSLIDSPLRAILDPGRYLTFRTDEARLVAALCRRAPETREDVVERVRAETTRDEAARAETARDETA